MATDSRNLRPFFFLFAGMIVWWFAPAAFRRVVHKTVFEFEAPAVLLSSRIEDLARYWELRSRSKDDLIRAGRDASRLVAMQQFETAQNAALREENSRLEKMLGLPSRPDFRIVTARVASRRLGMWWQQLILRRGEKDGVRAGCPVVNAYGVVGRVREVFRDSCVVELVSSPSFRISAKISGAENFTVIYRGTGAQPFSGASGIVSDIPSAAIFSDAPAGARDVVTSGLGGIFPAGLKIGTMSGTPDFSSSGIFREASVALPARLSSIEEAAILIPVANAADDVSENSTDDTP